MEPNLKELFNAAKDVRLTPDERTRIGAPLRRVRSPYAFLFVHVPRQVLAVTLMVILAGSSTAFAASGALPGDILFPVKIHVNERVESLLAVTPQAQAQVAADQATRRLDEAEALVHQGRLSEAATKEVEADFTVKAEEVQRHVKRLRDSHDESDADKVEKRFKDSVDTHFNSFVKLEDGEGSTTKGVNDVRQTLERHRESRDRRGGDRTEGQQKSDTTNNRTSQSGDSHGGQSDAPELD